jgi:hypothetical protein
VRTRARWAGALAALGALVLCAASASADSFTPVRLTVTISPVAALGVALPIRVTVGADPGVLDTARSPLRMRAKLTSSECGASFATTAGSVLLDRPMQPQPATGHAYNATVSGGGRPTGYGQQTVCAFLEESRDGRMYANDTADPPLVNVTRACTSAARRYQTDAAALTRAQRQLRRARGTAAKARLKALVTRRSASAAAARRSARAACGRALGL